MGDAMHHPSNLPVIIVVVYVCSDNVNVHID